MMGPMAGGSGMGGGAMPPGPDMGAGSGPGPEMGGGIADMIKSAIEVGMEGVSDPMQAAQVLRDLADMLEQGGTPEV